MQQSPPSKQPSFIARVFAVAVIDGTIQGVGTLWLWWFLSANGGAYEFSPWLWWVGTTLYYGTGHMFCLPWMKYIGAIHFTILLALTAGHFAFHISS